MKVVRLSALRTARLYPPGNIPGTYFCYRLSQPQGHSAAGRITYRRKILMTPSEIEHATFRLVAQCFNQQRYRGILMSGCENYNFLQTVPVQTGPGAHAASYMRGI
jgi:hypothetical protein